MTSSFFERLVLSLVLSTAVGICGYYCSKLVNFQSNGRRKSLAARRLATAPRQSLQKLQASGHWVALCGTAFDVTGDPFFEATCAGIYSSWVNHDVTYLLLQLGLVPDTKDDAKARASYLDRECQLDTLTGDDEETRRRRELIKEWFVRFHSRYEVVAQLSDRYVGAQWEALRAELLPSDSGSGGKCPLGFGAKTVSKSTVSLKPEDLKNMRTISFQGRRYDVTNSKLFHPDGGKFAHFVGHDITYTLAMQSMQVEDLDVAPEKSYTFEEQLLLERYRNIFARTLVLLEVDEEQSENGNRMNEANLHQLIERSDGIAQDECVKLLNKALENATGDQVNAVCPRTMMTPLQKAVEKHRLDLVEVLVRAGADTEERAALYDDETPLQMACRFRFDDIAAYLKTVTLGGN